MRRLLASLVVIAALSWCARPAPSEAQDGAFVREVVCAPQYAWDCATAQSIVWRESRNQSDALNPSSLCAGWWQIHPMHGYSIEALSDPYFNTQVAYGLWLQRGWQPWTS